MQLGKRGGRRPGDARPSSHVQHYPEDTKRVSVSCPPHNTWLPHRVCLAIPHWYLGVIGSDPQLRGKGFRRALMRARLDLCDTRERSGPPGVQDEDMGLQTPPEPRILTGSKRELKWAVGSATGLRSSIWRVKAHSRTKDGQHNVYVGTKELMHAVKLSLHEPSIWQIGFDGDYFKKRWPHEKRQPFQTFRPAPELAPGWKHAAVILVPTTSLAERRSLTEQEAAGVQWWPAPPPSEHLQFHVVISERDSDPSIVVRDMSGAVGCIRFGSRWSVSVLATTIPLTEEEHSLIGAEREGFSAKDGRSGIAWGETVDDGTPTLIDL